MVGPTLWPPGITHRSDTDPMETETAPSTTAFAPASSPNPTPAEAALVAQPGISTLATGRNLNASASPFRLVVDPTMRADLRRGLFHQIDHHDTALAGYVSEGKLSLDSYKEYIELFARSLRETMDSREGVLYLLRCAQVELGEEQVNLQPEWRWK